MDWNSLRQNLEPKLIDAGLKLLTALVIWIIGRLIIRFLVNVVANGMDKRKIDSTLVRYMRNTASVLFTVLLGLAIAGFLGIETTSFAAFIAAFGLAVGAAWSGMLANFAAGAFLVVLRPFKSGDFISGGGITGTVEEIGMFVTTINTPDNVRTFVGNNKLFSDNIQNYSANPSRRVDLTAPLARAEDPNAVIAKLQAGLAAIPNVLKDPAPSVTILTFTSWGCILAVRPNCHTDHYWQVYFDTNELIRKTLGTAGFPPAEVRLTA
ncbi:MAG: mechanosensitive ion channel family protein [Acidobacteria bacterium]|nr:mechanosensitive ion channel family protein [Acidobacteriota bacterium]